MGTQGFDWASAAAPVVTLPEAGMLDKVIEATEAIMPEPSALEAIERASVDVQIATAKRYPRGSMQKIQARIEAAATMDEATAASCFYVLKRKAKDGDSNKIEGPSIRLAEFCFSLYQNMRGSAICIGNDGKKVTCRGECHDLENNVYFAATVERSILTRDGNTFSNDMQIVTANAGNSIAFRNAVFRVVPKSIVNAVLAKCKAVALGHMKSVKDLWKESCDRFAKGGISEQQLLGWLERISATDVTREDIQELIGLYTSLAEKQTTVEEQFGDIGSRKTQEALAETKIASLTKAAEAADAGDKKEADAPKGAGEPDKPKGFGGFGKKRD